MAIKKATLKAIIDGVLTELMVKTSSEQVYLDSETTLTAKLAEMIAAINLRAKSTDVEAQVNALRQELLGDVPVEAYNTFTELATYISEHQEISETITEAIGNKADKTVVENILITLNTLGSIATKNKISETDLDDNLKEKVNTSSEGNHSHNNKDVLDNITSAKVTNWDSAANDTHTHSNKSIIDGITAGDVSAWNSAGNNSHAHSNKTVLDGVTSTKITNWDSAATNEHSHNNKDILDDISVEDIAAWNNKSTIHVSTTQPENLKAGDVWFHVY